MLQLHGSLTEAQEKLETAEDETDPERQEAYFQEAQTHLDSAHSSARLMQFIMSPNNSTPTDAQ